MKLPDKKQEEILDEKIMADNQVEDEEFTEEETQNQLRAFEGDMIQGLIAAAGFKDETVKTIEIARNGIVYFTFRIQPLTEEEYDQCKRKHTKYVRNKQIGIKVAESTNAVKYRDALIYQATVAEDRDKLWDNRKVWNSLQSKGQQVMNGLDVIEYALRAGEKDKIIDVIDNISGYEDQLEEVAKN